MLRATCSESERLKAQLAVESHYEVGDDFVE